MATETKRRNLGRGLSALLGEEGEGYAQLDKLRVSKLVPIEFIHPGRYQPRRVMHEDQIQELAESIKEKGVLQPLLVRRHPDEANAFEIIAGERRWRASQRAGIHELPVIIKDLTDVEALEIALVENLQRQDLSALEEAEGYRRLMEEFTHTQEDLAKAVGKSRSHVANSMRLLTLPDAVKKMMDTGALSAGHARAILSVSNPEEVARQVIKKGLNVRQTERLAKAGPPKAPSTPAEKDADTIALEKDLTNLLGLKTEIRFRGEGGAITVHYGTLEQLDDVLHRLTHGSPPPTAGLDKAGIAPKPVESVGKKEAIPAESAESAESAENEAGERPAKPATVSVKPRAKEKPQISVKRKPDQQTLDKTDSPETEKPQISPAGRPKEKLEDRLDSEKEPDRPKPQPVPDEAFPDDWVTQATRGELAIDDD
jgi:ParB family transcriptional regulator, chromosome partitioning protein